MVALNQDELEIMMILINHGPLKPSDIQEKLQFQIKNSLLRWKLGVLVEKGHLKREKHGKAFFYRAITPRENLLKKYTSRLADVFCGGSAIALIGQMIDGEENLSDEDIKELRRIARKASSPNKGENQ